MVAQWAQHQKRSAALRELGNSQDGTLMSRPMAVVTLFPERSAARSEMLRSAAVANGFPLTTPFREYVLPLRRFPQVERTRSFSQGLRPRTPASYPERTAA